MTDHSKGFDRKFVVDPCGLDRLRGEALRIEAIKAQAAPPPAMSAAPVAPARGPQQLVPSFTVTMGGMRRIEGAHWRGLSPLAAAVAQASLRHQARGKDTDFVPPFSAAQVAMAEDYAALVEWREGSPLRCASLEGGRSAVGGSGLFIDSYIAQGDWLAVLRDRIGDGVAMSVRRNMDRGNARRSITVRAAVDMLAVGGKPIKVILRNHGWAGNIRETRELRDAICGALDRMQGYRDEGGAK